MSKSNPLPSAGHYNPNYKNFQTELYAKIRREGFGENIGQNSWLTVDEQDRFLEWLDLAPAKVLLDVACGPGGPALRIAAITGCSVVGIDVHEDAIATATALAATRKLAERAHFLAGDATSALPFPDCNFDATHPGGVGRLLKPGGRLLFTAFTRSSPSPPHSALRRSPYAWHSVHSAATSRGLCSAPVRKSQ